jgi:hypothetical protein
MSFAFDVAVACVMPDSSAAQAALIEAMAWQKGVSARRSNGNNDVDLATALYNGMVLKEVSKR